jgi:hypothetical protein
MAGLNGAVFDLQLPNTGIRLNYAAEKLFHVNGTPREDFVPPVAVKLSYKRTGDVILEEGIRTLRGLIKRQPNMDSTQFIHRRGRRERRAGAERIDSTLCASSASLR